MAGRKKQKKKKYGFVNMITTMILIIAITVFGVASFKLITIYLAYRTGSEEYKDLSDQYAETERVTEGFVESSMAENDQLTEEGPDAHLTEGNGTLVFEEMTNPIDFKSLKEINSDVIGWVQMEAVSSINYPIVQGDDNDYYLHRTFQKTDNFAGSIFMDYINRKDFSQQNSVLYGHNMKNGSMFGVLSDYRDIEVYEKSPYFWIYTPTRIYKYEIFACSEVEKAGVEYQVSFQNGEDFMEYIYRIRDKALYPTNADISKNDTIVTLSTCTGNEETRFIVQGKRIRTYRAAGAEEFEEEQNQDETYGMEETLVNEQTYTDGSSFEEIPEDEQVLD